MLFFAGKSTNRAYRPLGILLISGAASFGREKRKWRRPGSFVMSSKPYQWRRRMRNCLSRARMVGWCILSHVIISAMLWHAHRRRARRNRHEVTNAGGRNRRRACHIFPQLPSSRPQETTVSSNHAARREAEHDGRASHAMTKLS